MAVKKLEPGMQFGRLTLLEEAGLAKSGNMRWRCRCSCGKETVVYASSLRNGGTRSCGCYRPSKNPYKPDAPKQGCRHSDCVYYASGHSHGYCNYFEVEGHTRTFLHQDEEGVDINNPCREYKRRGKDIDPKTFHRVELF